MTKLPSSGRDPRAEKERDKARQRKIQTNSSDKASRKNAPLIKARANRGVRRTDKKTLAQEADGFEFSADTINKEHMHKAKHWGTHNAANHRSRRMEKQDHYRNSGGRKAADAASWQDIKENSDDEAVIEFAKKQIVRLKKD